MTENLYERCWVIRNCFLTVYFLRTSWNAQVISLPFTKLYSDPWIRLKNLVQYRLMRRRAYLKKITSSFFFFSNEFEQYTLFNLPSVRHEKCSSNAKWNAHPKNIDENVS